MGARLSAGQVSDALKTTHGLMAPAAKLLGCSRMSIWRYCQKYAMCREAAEEASESVLDFGEGRLFEAVNNGEAWAIAFLLKTKGKGRGYTEKLIHEGGDPDRPIRIAHTTEEEEAATREYLARIARGSTTESGGAGNTGQ